MKQAAQSGPELQNSLQQERERSARLEQDLAAARRDIETQTALAAKASEEALQRKQTAEAGTRADALAQDLSLTRGAIHANEAQARKARDEAAELRRAAAERRAVASQIGTGRARAVRTAGAGSCGGATRCGDPNGAGGESS